MTQDPLQKLWISPEITKKENVMHSIQSILERDAACRKREQRASLWLAPVYVLLAPALLWFAAIGKTPVVRAGYALMASGVAIALFAGWLFASWSRQALPGPVVMRSQLQKAAFLLSRQASLARSSPLWAAPVFLGAALIGLWSYQQRGPLGGCLLWALLALAWLVVSLVSWKKARAAEQQRAKMEELLGELG